MKKVFLPKIKIRRHYLYSWSHGCSTEHRRVDKSQSKLLGKNVKRSKNAFVKLRGSNKVEYSTLIVMTLSDTLSSVIFIDYEEVDMKNKLITVLGTLMFGVLLAGCSDMQTTVIGNSNENYSENSTETEEVEQITYNADFYDNNGNLWLTAEGKTFKIRPNKVKTYSYDSNGSWISSYEMSSVMSIDIDGKSIESCGSTVIFSDNRLEKAGITFDSISTVDDTAVSADITVSIPSDLRAQDWLKIQYWWSEKSLNNKESSSKIIVVQSQLGNPIAVYVGDDVTWDIPRNLPKTTEVMIDGMPLYIHRANFSIIDTELLP